MATVTATIRGVPGAIAAFEEMKRAVRNRVLRKAARQGNRPQLVAARSSSTFADRSGLLRRSLSVRIKTYRQSGVTAAVTGPATKVRGTYNGKEAWPAKYAHIVEGGQWTRRIVAPKPFMQRAFNSTTHDAESKFTSKFVIEIYAEAAKAANNP